MPNLTLRAAVQSVIHDSSVPIALQAEELGVSYGYLTGAANPEIDRIRFAARLVVPITRITGNYTILDTMEASLGRVAFTLPNHENLDTKQISELFLQTAANFGKFANELDKALEDSIIDEREKIRIWREGYAAVQQLVTVMHRCKDFKK